MEKEIRSFALQDVHIEDREGQNMPVIFGHAAVFNSLSENLGGFRERIRTGAFREAIDQDDIRALFNHNPDYILGRNRSGTLKLSEDERGLAIEIDPPDTNVARDLIASMKRGDVTQMSFGFSVKPDGQEWAEDDDGMIIRTLTNVRLFDVSPVTYPAYPETDVAVRSLQGWRKELEQSRAIPLSLFEKYQVLSES